MGSPLNGGSRPTARLREAADWVTLLGRQAVTTDELRAFRRWKRDGRNAAAFAEVEQTWKQAEALRNDPAMAGATAAALNRARRKPGLVSLAGRHPIVATAVCAITLLLGIGIVWPLVTTDTYASAIGEQRRIQLADGSRLTLDADSSASVRMARDDRSVQLKKGRAFFEVAHDARRPFTVKAAATETRAIGTRFTVENRSGSVAVTLVQGSVEVRSKGVSPRRLSPGQELIVARHGSAKVATADLQAATSWTSGRLIFRSKPLKDAIDEVNSYSRRKVVLRADEFGDRLVSGAFDAGDTASFAVGVAKVFDLKSHPAEDGSIVIER